MLYVKSVGTEPYISSTDETKSDVVTIPDPTAQPVTITYTVDFESETSTYADWTFNNFTSAQTGNIIAHIGTYYGTTGGKTTGWLQFNSSIAKPKTLTFFVSKQTTNTKSSNWHVQKSTDGTNWTDINTQSATSMSKGTWIEISLDLSSYSNIYVRIYYNGSTAVRNIDDVQLVIEK